MFTLGDKVDVKLPDSNEEFEGMIVAVKEVGKDITYGILNLYTNLTHIVRVPKKERLDNAIH